MGPYAANAIVFVATDAAMAALTDVALPTPAYADLMRDSTSPPSRAESSLIVLPLCPLLDHAPIRAPDSFIGCRSCSKVGKA